MCCDINNQLPVFCGCISNIRNNRQKQKIEYAANPNAGAHGSLFENQIEENKTDKISCGICNQVNGCKTAKHCVQLEHLDGQGKEKAKEKRINARRRARMALDSCQTVLEAQINKGEK